MMKQYIRFDWAMRHLLRCANGYDVLEGLLVTLLNEPVRMCGMWEAEDDPEDEYDKLDRMDMLVENSKGEQMLVEVQNNNEHVYYQRHLFGVSKPVTACVNRRSGYEHINRIYCINLVYFMFYYTPKANVYRGTTELRSDNGDVLNIFPFQFSLPHVSIDNPLLPEYYILVASRFSQKPQSSFEEWAYYLNTGCIPEKVTAPGLAQAKNMLSIDRMSKSDQKAYYSHLDNMIILRSNIFTGRFEGRFEGCLSALRKTVRKMKTKGMDVQTIREVTGLSSEEFSDL